MKSDKLFLGFLLLFGAVVLSLWDCASKQQVKAKNPIVKPLKKSPSQGNPSVATGPEGWLNKIDDTDTSSGEPLNSTYGKVRLFLGKIAKNFSSWHPYVAPFPVVLLVLAPWFFVLNWIRHRLEFSWMVKFCLWGGFLTSLLALLSGYPTSQDSLPQTQHAIAGEFVFWVTGLCIGIRYLTLRWETKLLIRIPMGLLLFLTGFLVLYSVYLSHNF